jgi:hypothetical protein
MFIDLNFILNNLSNFSRQLWPFFLYEAATLLSVYRCLNHLFASSGYTVPREHQASLEGNLYITSHDGFLFMIITRCLHVHAGVSLSSVQCLVVLLIFFFVLTKVISPLISYCDARLFYICISMYHVNLDNVYLHLYCKA